MGVDEALARQRGLELHAQLVDVDVDRAVAVAQLAAPHRWYRSARETIRAARARERDEQLELAHAEGQRLAAGEARARRAGRISSSPTWMHVLRWSAASIVRSISRARRDARYPTVKHL